MKITTVIFRYKRETFSNRKNDFIQHELKLFSVYLNLRISFEMQF